MITEIRNYRRTRPQRMKLFAANGIERDAYTPGETRHADTTQTYERFEIQHLCYNGHDTKWYRVDRGTFRTEADARAALDRVRTELTPGTAFDGGAYHNERLGLRIVRIAETIRTVADVACILEETGV